MTSVDVPFKSKNKYNSTIVDDNGIGLGYMIDKASESEGKILIETSDSSKIDNVNK